MPLLQNSLIPATGAAYEIESSLRFNDDDSAYLTKTPASAGNRKTWTFATRIKRGNLTRQVFFDGYSALAGHAVEFTANHTLLFYSWGGATSLSIETSAVYRDPSAWYELVIALDTTQATSSDRVKIYINGEQVTSFLQTTYPAQNADLYINNNVAHSLGRRSSNAFYFDGYLTETRFIDGQALDPSNFGETGDYGEWKPIEYTGTYGSNGFYLDFENSGSLGADVSGNGNNWTPTNLAATDQMLDSPTNNFCTIDPLNNNWEQAGQNYHFTLAEGNLKATLTATNQNCFAGCTQLIPKTGKWYWETKHDQYAQVGVVDESKQKTGASANFDVHYYTNSGDVIASGTTVYNGSGGNAGEIIGVAVDMDSLNISFYRNGTLHYQYTSLPDKQYVPAIGCALGQSNPMYVNFGQDSSFSGSSTAQGNTDDNGYGDFYYTPPSGFLALCTQNLPDATVIPSEHFAANLRTGTGGNTSVTGMSFAPDLVWIKARSFADWHQSFDILRGTLNRLHSNASSAESTEPNTLTAFNSDGYSLGGSGGTNGSGKTFVDWCWKGNGSGSSNTDGSITSTVSANTTAGFSVVSWTGTGALATVGHGLSQAPDFVIYKNRDTSSNWIVYERTFGATCRLLLDLTNAIGCVNNTGYWNDTDPSSTVLTVNTDSYTNGNGNDMIAYAFHSVEGHSKISTYEGNGSSDGTFVYTGFRPAYIMIKEADATSNWSIVDDPRGLNRLHADEAVAEYSGGQVDFTSNGFKLRDTNSNFNTSGSTYIYLAIAENPFKHTNAR